MHLIYQTVIPLKPITKKNSQQIIQIPIPHSDKKRPCIVPSKAYKQYEADCKPYVKWTNPPISDAVRVECTYFIPLNKDGTVPKAKLDLVNLIEATADILTKYNVLADDNVSIVRDHDGSRAYYVSENPRTEIKIYTLEEEP